MTAIFVANRSSVLIDGAAVEGLQSLAFRVVTEREDIRAEMCIRDRCAGY